MTSDPEAGPDLDLAQILAILDDAHSSDPVDPNEGRRERKKRQLRQRISNAATALFLTRGFERVTVTQIADLCDVSEQTVFNYFPTKEEMFFDRTDASINALADAVRHRGDLSLIDVVVSRLSDDSTFEQWDELESPVALQLFRRFCNTVKTSPTLMAAQHGDLTLFISTVADALAERTGANPADPEIQVVAVVILGLLHTRTHSTFHHAPSATSFAEIAAAVRDNIARAAAVVAPALAQLDNHPEGCTNQARPSGEPRGPGYGPPGGLVSLRRTSPDW